MLKTRRKKLGRIDSPKKAAKYMEHTAKMLAPRYTGETIRGIRARKLGKTLWTVESRVVPKGQKGFMQNLWTNQTYPHRRPMMYWNKGKPTLYGDGSHNITGLPRWFHFSTLRTRDKFRKITRNTVRDILKINIG